MDHQLQVVENSPVCAGNLEFSEREVTASEAEFRQTGSIKKSLHCLFLL